MIADVEGRTTRRAYAKLTSNESARDFGSPMRSSSENQLRKSGRARNSVNYARFSGPDDNAMEVATPEQNQESHISPAQQTTQMAPSTPASSNSNKSTSMRNPQSRSTSRSTAPSIEKSGRPNLSWNAIVYEVLAIAKGPLTFTQLMQGIKSRYPFFKSSSQHKVLKSGLKNPLYFHEAFVKGEVINGKQTWGLLPGEFVDKKTGEVLTPQPRNPISSARRNEPVREMRHSSPVEPTPTVSHARHPRSSQPRFGREILNSPEIPDSQDAMPTTSIPQAADSRVAAEHESLIAWSTEAQEQVDTAIGTSANTSPKTDVSVHSPQPRLQGAHITGGPTSHTSLSKSPVTAGAEDQNIRKFISPIDREASAIAVQSNSLLQASQPPPPSTVPSTEESREEKSPDCPQLVATPISPVSAASPQCVPTLPEDGASTSQTSCVVPATPTPSATSIACTQMYVILSSALPVFLPFR